jgi:hypothetical protein
MLSKVFIRLDAMRMSENAQRLHRKGFIRLESVVDFPPRLAYKAFVTRAGWMALTWLAIELAASFLTLAGIYVGSTTATGAGLYLASLVFWYALTIGRRLWGLMPLNVASTVVSTLNLWSAMHGQ